MKPSAKKIPPQPFRPKVWWACVHCGFMHGELENPPDECEYCGRSDDFDNVHDLWSKRGWLGKAAGDVPGTLD